jgi:hypothetical protein
LFCLPFGFSYLALHIATLVLGLMGLAFLYASMREMRGSRPMALFAALTLAVDPLYFDLANSFMTDVPFVALMMISTYALIRGLNRMSLSWLMVGIFFAVLTILLRQVGIALLIAFAVAWPLRKGVSASSILTGIMLVLFGVGLHFTFQHWLIVTGRAHVFMAGVQAMLPRSLSAFIGTSIRYSIFVLPYVGAALVPYVLAAKIWQTRDQQTRSIRSTILLAAVPVVLFALLWWKQDTLPVLGNVLMETGLGPLTQRDTYLLHINLPPVPSLVAGIWLAMSALGVAAALWVLMRAASAARVVAGNILARRQSATDSAWIFILTLTVTYWATILVLVNGNGYFFDRYLLPLVPLGLLLVPAAVPDRPPPAWRWLVAGLPLLSFAIVSVTATHDYLAWNRARWAMLGDLMDRSGIPAEKIDGGYEFNGSVLYDPDLHPPKTKSYWWVRDDEYVLASGPMQGYDVVGQTPVDRWLPIGPAAVLALHRRP